MSNGSPIDDLMHVPVRVVASWIPKTVTTDPPKYVPHTEYALAWTFECAIPVLPVMMLANGQQGQFTKPWRSSAMQALQCRLSFSPGDWKTSQQVWINFEGLQIIVEDLNLKHDPRTHVRTELLGEQHIIETGCVVTLAAVDTESRIDASLLLVAKCDTDAKRGRWALKQSVGSHLPARLLFLLHGQCAGRF